MPQSYEKHGVASTSRAAHFKNLCRGTYSKQQAAILAVLKTDNEPLTAKELAPLVGQIVGKPTTVSSDISLAMSLLKKSGEIIICTTKKINGHSSNAVRLTTAAERMEFASSNTMPKKEGNSTVPPEGEQGKLFRNPSQSELGDGIKTKIKE